MYWKISFLTGISLIVGGANAAAASQVDLIPVDASSNQVEAGSETDKDVLALVRAQLGENVAKHTLAYSVRPAAKVVLTNLRCPEPVPDPRFNGGDIAFLIYDGQSGALPGCYVTSPFGGIDLKWANGYGDSVQPSDLHLTAKHTTSHDYDQDKIAEEGVDSSTIPSAPVPSNSQCHSESDLAYKVAQASMKGIPVETMRATLTKVLDGNHVSTSEYNRYIQMVNRAYAWQKHGYAPEEIRDADFQACKGTPTLEVPVN